MLPPRPLATLPQPQPPPSASRRGSSCRRASRRLPRTGQSLRSTRRARGALARKRSARPRTLAGTLLGARFCGGFTVLLLFPRLRWTGLSRTRGRVCAAVYFFARYAVVLLSAYALQLVRGTGSGEGEVERRQLRRRPSPIVKLYFCCIYQFSLKVIA
jgi:hypothetical protein